MQICQPPKGEQIGILNGIERIGRIAQRPVSNCVHHPLGRLHKPTEGPDVAPLRASNAVLQRNFGTFFLGTCPELSFPHNKDAAARKR